MTINTRMAILAFAAVTLATTAKAQLPPAEEGRRLWLANNCYGCHGGRAGGSSFVAPQFRGGEVEIGDLGEVIHEGGERGMPAFRSLTSTDIANLAAYLKSLRTSSEPIFNDWWEPVPTARNRVREPQLYAAARQTRSGAALIKTVLAAFGE